MSALSPARERRCLQVAVSLLALVPIAAGLGGVLGGLDAFDARAVLSLSADSHVRYLSGLILAIGLGFWSTVPHIEAHGARFRLLAALVVVGGLARLYALLAAGLPSAAMIGGLVMELAITPGLALWRERVERRLQARRPTRLISAST